MFYRRRRSSTVFVGGLSLACLLAFQLNVTWPSQVSFNRKTTIDKEDVNHYDVGSQESLEPKSSTKTREIEFYSNSSDQVSSQTKIKQQKKKRVKRSRISVDLSTTSSTRVQHAFALSEDGNFIAIDRYAVRHPDQKVTIAVLGDGIVPLEIKEGLMGKEEVHTDMTCSMGNQVNTQARIVLMNGPYHMSLKDLYFAPNVSDTRPFSGNTKLRTMMIFCDGLHYVPNQSNNTPLTLTSRRGSFSVRIESPFVDPGIKSKDRGDYLDAVHCLTPLFSLKEPHWIIEYIEYHLAAGVSHMHIYNYDLDSPSIKFVFEEFERSGKITYHDWSRGDSRGYTGGTTYEHGKWAASTDCFLRSRGLYDYALFSDVDEVWLGEMGANHTGDIATGLSACQKAYEESNGTKIACSVNSITMSSVFTMLSPEEIARNKLLLRRYWRSEVHPYRGGNCACQRFGPDPNDHGKERCLQINQKYHFGRQKYIANTRDLSVEPRPLFTHAISRNFEEMDQIMTILPENTMSVRHYQGHWLSRLGVLETMDEREIPLPHSILDTVERNIESSETLRMIYTSKSAKGLEWITPIERTPNLVVGRQGPARCQ